MIFWSFFYLYLFISFSNAHILSIGVQLPLNNGDQQCAQAWQAWKVAQTTLDSISKTNYWKNSLLFFSSSATSSSNSPITLALEAIPYDTPYNAWAQAEKFASKESPLCTSINNNTNCYVKRIGIIGPSSSASLIYALLPSRISNLPHFGYSATLKSLTQATDQPLDYSIRQPFFRMSYIDDIIVGGLFQFMQTTNWEIFSILYVRNDYGTSSAQTLSTLSTSSSSHMELVDSLSFESGDITSVDIALQRLLHGHARIFVLFAYSSDASLVLNRAHKFGMTGKGWTWLGGEWVRESTFITPFVLPASESESSSSGAGHRQLFLNEDDPSVRASQQAVYNAMQGVVGVIGTPITSAPDALLNDELIRRAFTFVDAYSSDKNTVTAAGGYGPNVFSAPRLDPSACPYMYEPPLTSSGLKLDEFSPYIVESIWTLVDAVATIFTVNNYDSLTDTEKLIQRETIFQALTNDQISNQLFNTLTTSSPSPLSGKSIKWLPNGDRYDISISLVNVQGKNFVPVGNWKSEVQPSELGDIHGLIANSKHHYDGYWINRETSPAIIWSSGLVVIPPDRVEHANHVESVAILVGLVGMAASLVVGAIFHKYHISIIPESAAVVIVGMIVGGILRLTASAEIRSSASFNGEFFMLVLLPIIIFESGYSLDRGPFFTQLFSINAYAILGTVISTIIIGGVVYLAGSTGSIISLSFEESMTFASLLSATDPVATLAVFGALRVDPVLNALVYGESVINDAVSLVLFRSFANFLVTEITTSATLYAIISFFVILFFSVLVGMAVGFFTTLIIRLINLTGILPKESEGLNSMIQRINVFQGSMMGRNQLPIIFKRSQPKKTISPKLGATNANIVAEVTGIDEENDKNNDNHDGSADDEHYFNAGDVFAGIAETALLLIFAYVSFALAEAISLSGIVSSLFCGIIMNSYTRKILSISGRHVSSGVFKMLATLADTAVFFQIGLNVILLLGVGEYHAAFIAVTLVGCLIGRAFNVFPISFGLNLGRKQKISFRYQIQMWYAGLRGAIAFASALSFPTQNRTTIINATSWICLFTIFAMGSTTTPMLKFLKVPYNVTTTEEEQAVEVNAATESSPTKRALRWIDKHIRRIIFGPVILSLMAKHGDAIIALSPARLPKLTNASPSIKNSPSNLSLSNNDEKDSSIIVSKLEWTAAVDDWSNIHAEAVPVPENEAVPGDATSTVVIETKADDETNRNSSPA